MEPLHEEVPDCGTCRFRSIPVHSADDFGHTKCSIHRECTGYTFWQPHMCTHCTQAERAMDQQDPNTRLAAIGKFVSMLKKQKDKINLAQPDRQWDYRPILEFRFKKYHYSHIEQNEQTAPIHENPDNEQVQSTTSPYDPDCLVIDTELNSYEKSEDDSDADDITASIAEVNSLNQQLEDVCTQQHCINENISAVLKPYP